MSSCPSRRVYFSLLHSGYLRNYAGAIRILCDRGHTVHVGLVRDEKHPGDDELLTDLAAECASFEFGVTPSRGQLDPWRAPAWLVRSLLDVARYAHPDYAHADALRDRSIAKMGLRRIGTLLLRRPLQRLAAPASRETVQNRIAVLLRLANAIPASRRITKELRDFRPDVVLASPVIEFASSQVDVLESARSLGVRTGVCVASWDNLTNKGLIRFRPDRVFVWNELQRREAVEYHGIPAEIVVATGAARFDPWFERSASTTRAEFDARVGLDPGPYLLYLCSSVFVAPDELSFVRRWLTALRGSDHATLREIGVLVRPHPHNALQWREADLREYGNVSVHPRVGTHPDPGDPAAVFYDSIAHSAGVVGINTSALIESAIAGKAVYTVLDPQFRQTQEGTLHFHYLRADRGGFVHEARSLDEHVAQLAAGLAGAATDASRILDFVGSFVRPGGLDVPAAEVMADAFEELAGRPQGTALQLAGVDEREAR